MKHFTMTGVYAGSTFCLSYVSKLGEGSNGIRNKEDEYAHYAYAPDVYVNADDVCDDCNHALDCGDCDRCKDMGWS